MWLPAWYLGICHVPCVPPLPCHPSLVHPSFIPPCQSAIAHGHDAVVLGAFGCGAFRNPAAHMAQLFREVSEPSSLPANDVGEGEDGVGL